MPSASRLAIIFGLLGGLAFCGPVAATQFPVSGMIVYGASNGPIPNGSSFGDVVFNDHSGYLPAGKFVFPQATMTNNGVQTTYQVTQLNTASGMVDAAGNAVMTTVKLKLHIISVVAFGTPLPVGSTCEFSPIIWDALGGTTDATGMDLTEASFTVPPTTDTCGGYASQINSMLTGSSGSANLQLAGDFSLSDGIFEDGFEPQP